MAGNRVMPSWRVLDIHGCPCVSSRVRTCHVADAIAAEVAVDAAVEAAVEAVVEAVVEAATAEVHCCRVSLFLEGRWLRLCVE